MRTQLLARVDQLVERAASKRNLGKKQFLNACGVAPASYYRWRESMQRGTRWEVPGWVLELVMHEVGADLSQLFSGLSALPWSVWPARGRLTLLVGSEDSPPQPLSFQKIAERDARAATLLVDGLRLRTPDSWSVEFVAISPSLDRNSPVLQDSLRQIIRDSVCVAAIGSPAVNPAVDVLARDYIFGDQAPPFRFRWPHPIQGSFLSDPRAIEKEVGVVRTDTGEIVVPADPLDRIATDAEKAGGAFACNDAAILAIDHRRAALADPNGDRSELPIVICCMGVGAAGTEAAVRALFEHSAAVDGFLRKSSSDTPEGLLFEPLRVSCEKAAGSRRDDMRIHSVEFARQESKSKRAERTPQT